MSCVRYLCLCLYSSVLFAFFIFVLCLVYPMLPVSRMKVIPEIRRAHYIGYPLFHYTQNDIFCLKSRGFYNVFQMQMGMLRQ
jgi:hypothetical protein